MHGSYIKRHIIKGAPVSNLQILLSKKEEELRNLYAGLEKVKQAVTEHGKVQHSTQVQFHRGIEGLKQMFWNETHSTTDNVSILYEIFKIKLKVPFLSVGFMNLTNVVSRAAALLAIIS